MAEERWGDNQLGQSSGIQNNNGGNYCRTMNIPPGFRFCPNDEELIYYLTCKLKGLQFPFCKHIEEVDIYAYSPMELSEKYKLDRETEWYFYTPRTKKYPNGDRPDRFAKDGFWKPSASGKPVQRATGETIGYVRTLNFRKGFEKDKNDQRTEWLMHEYTLEKNTSVPTHSHMMLDKWVLVKIYKKRGSSNNANQMEGKNATKEVVQSMDLQAPQSHNHQSHHQVHMPPLQQFQFQAPQIFEETQDQTRIWTPRSIPVAQPAHQSSLLQYYYNDMDSQHYDSNSRFNGGFSAQQMPSLQTFGLNESEAIAQQIMPPFQSFGLSESSLTVAPHHDGQFYDVVDQNCLKMDQVRIKCLDASQLAGCPNNVDDDQMVLNPPNHSDQREFRNLMDDVFYSNFLGIEALNFEDPLLPAPAMDLKDEGQNSNSCQCPNTWHPSSCPIHTSRGDGK